MVLVTGATGLLGSHLLMELCDAHENIRAIYRTVSSVEKIASIFKMHQREDAFKKIDWVQADVLDIPQLENAFKDIHIVFHCAGFISFDSRHKKQLLRVNKEGTANMVNLSLAHGVNQFIYVSSIAALGKGVGPVITEETESLPTELDVYGLSKHLGEIEVWRGAQEGLKVQIVNPGVIIGPHFWQSGSGALFRFASKGYPFTLPGGTGVVGVQEVVKAMLLLSNTELAQGNYILVNQNMSFKDLSQFLAKSLRKEPPKQMISPLALGLLWRIDWLWSRITGSHQQLTRSMIKNTKNPKLYDGKKITKINGFCYGDIVAEIDHTGAIFLAQE